MTDPHLSVILDESKGHIILRSAICRKGALSPNINNVGLTLPICRGPLLAIFIVLSSFSSRCQAKGTETNDHVNDQMDH